jgi:hypothetical protein
MRLDQNDSYYYFEELHMWCLVLTLWCPPETGAAAGGAARGAGEVESGEKNGASLKKASPIASPNANSATTPSISGRMSEEMVGDVRKRLEENMEVGCVGGSGGTEKGRDRQTQTDRHRQRNRDR